MDTTTKISRRPKLTTLAVAGLLTAGGSLAVAPTAATAAETPTCEEDYVCMFEDANWEGNSLSALDVVIGSTGQNSLNHWYIGDIINDKVSSIYNNTNKKLCFYSDANYGGRQIAVLEPRAAIAGFPLEDNDVLSSYRLC